MELSHEATEAELNWFAFEQAMDALKALARGEARVLLDEDELPTGVAWCVDDCEEEIRWEN